MVYIIYKITILSLPRGVEVNDGVGRCVVDVVVVVVVDTIWGRNSAITNYCKRTMQTL